MTNQDGLAFTFPGKHILPAHEKCSFEDRLSFQNSHDKSRPEEQTAHTQTRHGHVCWNTFSPDVGFDQQLYVIGDRLNDIELAKTLGCKAILFNADAAVNCLVKFLVSRKRRLPHC